MLEQVVEWAASEVQANTDGNHVLMALNIGLGGFLLAMANAYLKPEALPHFPQLAGDHLRRSLEKAIAA